MPFTDELILQQLSELNSTLKRIEALLAAKDVSQIPMPNVTTADLRDYPYVYCDQKTASELTGLSKSWFERMRCYGGGPPYSKIGSRVRYKVSDLSDYFENNKVSNTSQIPGSEQPVKRKRKVDVTF